MAGLVGLGTGYLTLRLRGVFFSIATWRWRSWCRR
jgi:branched-chain amino acid transport system permease protein